MKANLTLLLSTILITFSFGTVLDAKKKSESLFPAKLLDSDGKEVSSEVLNNKIIGIYFSAQWCPPCRHFTPSLVEFRDKNKKDFLSRISSKSHIALHRQIPNFCRGWNVTPLACLGWQMVARVRGIGPRVEPVVCSRVI